MTTTTQDTLDGGRTEAAAGVAEAAPRKESAARRRPSTKAKSVRWVQLPRTDGTGRLHGMIRVTAEDGTLAFYSVALLDESHGYSNWDVRKEADDGEYQAEPYVVTIGTACGAASSCTCPAWRWSQDVPRRCRHTVSVRAALMTVGRR
jgi:hypothetical protein